MIRITWQDSQLDVRRLVLRADDRGRFDAALRAAAALRLDVADDRAAPRPGDFWVGCHPRAGWGAADPAAVGWAGVLEVPVALAALRAAPAVSP